MDWAKITARRDEKRCSFWWFDATYIRGLTVWRHSFWDLNCCVTQIIQETSIALNSNIMTPCFLNGLRQWQIEYAYKRTLNTLWTTVIYHNSFMVQWTKWWDIKAGFIHQHKDFNVWHASIIKLNNLCYDEISDTSCKCSIYVDILYIFRIYSLQFIFYLMSC